MAEKITKEELLALSPEKVNELAATEIMKRHISPEGRYYWWENASDGYMCRQAVNEWHPMSNIADAWLLLEKFPTSRLTRSTVSNHKWQCTLFQQDEFYNRTDSSSEADTAPAAITLACVAAALEVE
uniref:Phage ABA sandwich domain-containing protein n=1 Tax=viral metagenome TaxID=1070528 RepID=A0A6M3JFE2_9ZZZZ